MPKILCAEDEPALQRLLKSMLELKGFEVTTVSDGQEAVESIQSGLPDLILMDLNMPVMDGFEAIRMIRAEDKAQAVPIVALSAWNNPQERKRAITAGANEYLVKPIDLKLFLAKVTQLLQA